MIYILIKIFITSILIVLISEIAKTNDKLGGLISAMPITTLLIIFWLYYENESNTKISNHMLYTFLYVLPTLPMFLIFPILLQKFGFYFAVGCSIILTIICIIFIDFFSKKVGFKIF